MAAAASDPNDRVIPFEIAVASPKRCHISRAVSVAANRRKDASMIAFTAAAPNPR